MINLEQDFIKFETNGDLAYYGYTNNLSALESDNVWSIRVMSGTGSTFDIKWSNKSKLNYISKWSNKELYFEDPAGLSPSLSPTWSSWEHNDFKYVLSVEWNEMAGVDNYDITIINQNNKIVDKSNNEIYNVYVDSVKTDTTRNTNYKFYAIKGETYSFTIEASNGYGTATESFDFIFI